MTDENPRVNDEIQRTWREGETTSATALADPDSTDPDSDTTDSGDTTDTTDSSDTDSTDS